MSADVGLAPLRVGVAVPALDEAAALPRLLARLLGPDVQALDRADDVVVADGGSRDETVARARAAGARVISPGRGRGVQLAAAAGALLEARAPDVLVFLHADSCPEPGALARVREAFLGGAEAAGFAQVIEAEGRVFRLLERAADRRVRRGMVYGDSGLAVRREVYQRAGGFPPEPLFEDVAFSRALCRAGVTVRLLADARLRISARRWQREGVLRCTARNRILRALFELGLPPRTLARLYQPHSTP